MKTRDKKLIEAVCLCALGYCKEKDITFILNSPEYAQFLADNPVEGLELWVARDEDGDAMFSTTKPRKITDTTGKSFFTTDDDECFYVDKILFPKITFENSPVRIRLVMEDTQ